MADHLHKQIRAAAVAALTGLATTGSRVYPNRLRVLQDADLPGLRIYLDDEDSEDVSLHQPVLQQRALTLVVEGCAKATAALDDTLDQVSKEVEVALSTGLTVGGHWLMSTYRGMNFDDEQLDKPVAIKRMKWLLAFHALSSTPDAFA